MHLATVVAALTLSIPAPVASQQPCLRESVAPTGIAFVDVTVIPMDRERLIAHQTVLVRGCRIERMGPRDSVVIPDGYRRIQGGDDAYLLPGLVESHTHLRYENDLTLYLARGVTTVRNLIGGPLHVQMKGAVRSGSFGPRVITAAPLPYGNQDWPSDRVHAFVESAAADGFDFLKVQEPVKSDVYAALVEAGRRHGMRVVGHIPTDVGLDTVLRAKQQTIEHAEQFNYHWFGDNYDRSAIPELAQRVYASGAAVTPTLSVIHAWIAVHADPTTLLDRTETAYVHPETFAYWNTFARTSSFDNRLIADFQNHLILELQRAGVPLLAGSDAYQIGAVGGWGLHRELRAMRAAGLGHYDVLRTVTSTPAQVFGYDAGVVAEGKLADLILVDGNPLQDLEALGRLRGVMRDGEWFQNDELDERLQDVARSYLPGLTFVRLALSGRALEAVEEHRRLRARGDPSRLAVDTMTYVASIVRQRGRANEAVRIYGLALEEDPGVARAHEGIARARLMAGRVKEARASLMRALEVDPDLKSARDLLTALAHPEGDNPDVPGPSYP